MKNKKISRRSALRSIAGAGLAVGSIGTVNARRRSDSEQTYMQAVRLRSRLKKLQQLPAGSPEAKRLEAETRPGFQQYLSQDPREAFRNYLTNAGFSWSFAHGERVSEEDEEVGTQAYDISKLSIDITLTIDCYNENEVFVDCFWDFDPKCTTYAWEKNGGNSPNDVIGMYWPSTDYSRIDNSEYTTNKYVLVGGEYGDLDSNGIAAEFNDADAWYFQSDATEPDCSGLSAGVGIYGGYGCKAIQNNPEDRPATRLVSGDYRHTQGSCGINSVGIGTGGLSVGYSCGDPLVWDYTLDEGEDGSSSNCAP
ncbi:hypothetical protein [Halorussus lipolyticus]|uniref:hypothetical protein n=1 Tax=Halorussus lipolyticus TaxID=3034024 RepID=UPI0023E8C19B|nr:hypothetical protein [Halorussus sp. DT80]